MTWHPSVLVRRLATAALLALAAAVATGHAALVLLAAPALAALALIPRARPPADMVIRAGVKAARCFEGEDIQVTVTVTGPGAEATRIRLVPAPQVTVAERAQEHAGTVADWTLRPARWGRYSPGTVQVTCVAGRGGWEARGEANIDPVDVFPRAVKVRPRLVPAELLRRIGEHTGRAVGDGVEFSAIRPYQPGDQLRDLNRPVSIRRGQPHVNQRAAARAADLVVVVDAFDDIGPPGNSTLDVAAHGAAALTAAYLRVGDRAGLVVLGGLLRWLGPAPGDRQFYRIAEMMLAARYESFITPDIGRVPRTALPPGSLVVLFSPLLEPGTFAAITDLRQRGFPVIVVDTLRYEPRAADRPGHLTAAGLGLRLWRLDRAAARASLAVIGVPVIGWPAGAELDGILEPYRRTAPLLAARP
jgi:uncharacterized protein (DUF58 family)